MKRGGRVTWDQTPLSEEWRGQSSALMVLAWAESPLSRPREPLIHSAHRCSCLPSAYRIVTSFLIPSLTYSLGATDQQQTPQARKKEKCTNGRAPQSVWQCRSERPTVHLSLPSAISSGVATSHCLCVCCSLSSFNNTPISHSFGGSEI